jgi:hypothetical protein
LKYHLSRHKSCEPIHSEISRDELLRELTHAINTTGHIPPDDNRYMCEYCNKTYKTNQTKLRHQKYKCNQKQLMDDDKLTEVRMQTLINSLRKEIKVLLSETNNHGMIGTIDASTNQTTNNTNQLINNVNNSKNLQINNYGKEDLSHITDDTYKDILKHPYSAMSKLMNEIHFNDDKPENQNLRIPNIKNPFAETFVDGEWVVSNQYKLLCKAYSLKKEILHQAFLRIKDQLDLKTQRLYYEFKEAIDGDMFVFQSQLKDIKATIISGTRHKPPLPSRHELVEKHNKELEKLLQNDIESCTPNK